MSPILFEHGVYGLSGLVIRGAGVCGARLREGSGPAQFDADEMVNHIDPSKYRRTSLGAE